MKDRGEDRKKDFEDKQEKYADSQHQSYLNTTADKIFKQLDLSKLTLGDPSQGELFSDSVLGQEMVADLCYNKIDSENIKGILRQKIIEWYDDKVNVSELPDFHDKRSSHFQGEILFPS